MNILKPETWPSHWRPALANIAALAVIVVAAALATCRHCHTEHERQAETAPAPPPDSSLVPGRVVIEPSEESDR